MNNEEINYTQIKKIAFSCESGIGASAMGAAVMNRIIDELKLDIEVNPVAIKNLTADYDLIITHIGFTKIIEKLDLDSRVVYINSYLDKKLFLEIGENIRDAKREKTRNN